MNKMFDDLVYKKPRIFDLNGILGTVSITGGQIPIGDDEEDDNPSEVTGHDVPVPTPTPDPDDN